MSAGRRSRSTTVLVCALSLHCGEGPGSSETASEPTSGDASSSGPSASDAAPGDSGSESTTSAASSGAADSEGGDTTQGDPDDAPSYLPSLESRELLCKLVSGEDPRDPSANHTHTRFNLRGTDLGISLPIGDVLHIFFGDTHGWREIWAVGEDPDSVGFADAAAVAADPAVLCSSLSFYVTPDVPSVAADTDPSIERDFAAGFMIPPPGEDISAYITHHPAPFPNIPGSFEVPSGALTIGDDVYLFWAGRSELQPRPRMTTSYLARWDPPRELPTYQIVRRLDAMADGALGGHFMQILPLVSDETIYMLGTGDFRYSGIHLARVPADALETGAGTELYDPSLDAWVDPTQLSFEDRAAIAPLLETDGVGELGGAFVAGPDLYVLLYQRELHGPGGGIVDNRIVLRTAPDPSGPWSDAVTVIDMADPAFQAEHCCGASCVGSQILHCESAGLYAAYPLPFPLATARDDGGFTLRLPFLASTWNPYDVALFEAHLALSPVRRGG